MVTLRNGTKARTIRAVVVNKATKRLWRKSYGTAVLEVEHVELPWFRQLTSNTTTDGRASPCTIQNGTNKHSKRPNKNGKITHARSAKVNKAIQKQRQKSAILEVEHVGLPLPRRLTSSTVSDDHTSRCTVNREARVAKRRSPFVRVTRKPMLTGPKRKHVPEAHTDMSHDELLKWSHHQRQLRNRQTAAACHIRKKMYIKELELKILDYKVKYEQLLHQIIILEEQELQTTRLMNATETNHNDTGSVKQEPQYHCYQHSQSARTEVNIALPRFFVPIPSLPVPGTNTSKR